MAKEILEMPVELATMELPDTKTIRLKWPDGHNPDFKTGQFITLYWPDTPNYKRAYSLSSCALDRGFYEVTVKRDGKMGTRIVDWAKAGDKFFVIPPVGKFLPVYEPNKHLICVAGGSGVTPFRGFVREATRRKLETKITILYSVRTPSDIIFNDEFRQLEQENPNFKFYVTCTRLKPERSLERARAGASRRMGQGARRRPGEHGFLRLRPQRAGGVCRGGCPARPRRAERADENGEMGMTEIRELRQFPRISFDQASIHAIRGQNFHAKTHALFSAHQKLGAKLIDFGGWEMPVQYTSIIEEHLAVRNAAGIFDISHMGEVTVSGAGAEAFLNSVLTNDIRKLGSGEGQYTLDVQRTRRRD